MKTEFLNERIIKIEGEDFTVPFMKDNYGFFVEKDGEKTNVELKPNGESFCGKCMDMDFELSYAQKPDCLEINVSMKNNGADFDGRIGFITGVDSYMTHYPQWNDLFFPTLLRCEKTHLWGYYMNTAENALAIATSGPVASYDISYNLFEESEGVIHCGHRILGSNIYFYQNTVLPERHPDNLKIFKSGETYTNTIYLIPVTNKADIKKSITAAAGVPTVDATKYTIENGEKLDLAVNSSCGYSLEFICPDGSLAAVNDSLTQQGVYTLKVVDNNGKTAEAKFFVRKDWDYYLEKAAENALSKPPKASTHTESFYGFFSLFLHYKHTGDKKIGDKAYEAFWETMPLMFDFEKCEPIVIPDRIQNTSGLISVLVDMYEAEPDNRLDCLKYAAGFADFLIKHQDATGAYKNKKVHYTCVIYIAKSMLELALAEKECGDSELVKLSRVHYESAKKAVDELVRNLDNIETEGEMTLEDGMISCSALQIGMFALTLPEEERAEYINAAEYMLSIHSCLEQQLIPDCRMNGASIRYWESQYDVMIRENMFNSPHGWTGWTLYAHYYLYMLTGKKKYLMSLMNGMGASAQLIDENGNLRWAFCAAPYIKAERAFVPDFDNEVKDGYKFVEPKEKAYRAKYVEKEFTEGYVDMISGWYRIGEQKVNGGYEFCPLILGGGVEEIVDTQGGCCDNDVHEIFKCMEETVLKKAFVHQNDDGSLTTFGCTAEFMDGTLNVECADNVSDFVYSFKNKTKVSVKSALYELSGFGTFEV